MNPLVVIIPSRSASNLAASIPAVVRNEPNARIIIVDDGIEWNNMGLPYGSGVKSVSGSKPFVFSRNINRGLREAGEADVVLLNDDAILETPGGFSLMQQCAADNPDVGIIGAVTNLTGQPLQRPLAKDHSQWGLREVEHLAFVCVLIPWRTRQALANAVCVPQVHREIDGRTDMYTNGLLDERYSAGYGSEDLDYCMQVRYAGLKVCVHDGCYVDHGSLHSSFRGLPTAAGNIWPNHRILRKKWGLQPAYHPQDPEGKRA